MENSRSYIDEIYSQDEIKCHEALIRLKNAVIGSNKQKESVISQGVVPRLKALIEHDNVPMKIRLDATIIIGKNLNCIFI